MIMMTTKLMAKVLKTAKEQEAFLILNCLLKKEKEDVFLRTEASVHFTMKVSSSMTFQETSTTSATGIIEFFSNRKRTQRSFSSNCVFSKIPQPKTSLCVYLLLAHFSFSFTDSSSWVVSFFERDIHASSRFLSKKKKKVSSKSTKL